MNIVKPLNEAQVKILEAFVSTEGKDLEELMDLLQNFLKNRQRKEAALERRNSESRENLQTNK